MHQIWGSNSWSASLLSVWYIASSRDSDDRWPAAGLPDTNTVLEPVVLNRRDRIPQSSQRGTLVTLPQTSVRRPVTPFNKIFPVIVRSRRAHLVRRKIRLLQKANRHQWRDAWEKLGYRSERIWDADNESVIWCLFFCGVDRLDVNDSSNDRGRSFVTRSFQVE